MSEIYIIIITYILLSMKRHYAIFYAMPCHDMLTLLYITARAIFIMPLHPLLLCPSAVHIIYFMHHIYICWLHAIYIYILSVVHILELYIIIQTYIYYDVSIYIFFTIYILLYYFICLKNEVCNVCEMILAFIHINLYILLVFIHTYYCSTSNCSYYIYMSYIHTYIIILLHICHTIIITY